MKDESFRVRVSGVIAGEVRLEVERDARRDSDVKLSTWLRDAIAEKLERAKQARRRKPTDQSPSVEGSPGGKNTNTNS